MGGSAESRAEQRAGLVAFARALRREVHVLIGHSDLTWQQLHNRLQWMEGLSATLAAAERNRRSSLGVAPWVRTRTPFRKSEALLQTLSGHTATVEGCAFSPDGARIVSASSDATLRVWDAVTGECLRALAGHTRRVYGCAVSPDGASIVSAGADATVRMWDAATGEELRTLSRPHLLRSSRAR